VVTQAKYGIIALMTKEKFLAKLLEVDDCWEWQGELLNGYGRLQVKGKRLSAHRFSYELFIGPIPSGLHIDHLCMNRSCSNPNHLEAVTPRENVRRAMSYRAAFITHCKEGHPYSGENLYPRSRNGHFEWRDCRICRNLKNVEYRKRRGEREPLFWKKWKSHSPDLNTNKYG
jgi:hypothetical protein